MTTPVRSFVQPGEGPFCSTDFTVSFFVPYDFIVKQPTSNPYPGVLSRMTHPNPIARIYSLKKIQK